MLCTHGEIMTNGGDGRHGGRQGGTEIERATGRRLIAVDKPS